MPPMTSNRPGALATNISSCQLNKPAAATRSRIRRFSVFSLELKSMSKFAKLFKNATVSGKPFKSP
eukprot:Gb_07322 [translate_table: standard]